MTPTSNHTTAEIRAWLVKQLAELFARDPDTIRTAEPLADYGLSSSDLISLTGQLEEWLGYELDATIAWAYPSIDALARHLGGEEQPSVPVTPSTIVAAPSTSHAREPIAVIGIGCHFPGANGPQQFWELLRDGRDAISTVPSERWDIEALYHANPGAPGRMNTRWGGFLPRIEDFDARFFRISSREGMRMDPQQRILLEVAWEALEHAGLPPEQLMGTPTGVFVGIATHDYNQFLLSDLSLLDTYVGTGLASSIAANRLSYIFDLRGPSIALDTACSSSLVAVHLACQSIWQGESTLALAGGVNLILRPELSIAFSKAGMLAPGGRCRTFDADAEGYVRSEGCGMVVLKPLSAALADGDRVLALIRSTATNQDGRSNGITAPNQHAQEAVIQRALELAGVAPAQIGYVEAHGTGTSLGDPIEMTALRQVLMTGRTSDQPCAFGSVKTNIGHAEAAAGIAGLIKTVLTLAHEAIPPNLHLRELNARLPIADTPFFVPTQLQPWPRTTMPRNAGVSSFGFGGSNAHIILTEAPPPLPALAPPPPYLLPISARTSLALVDMARSYRDWLGAPSVPLHAACAMASHRRSHHEHRLGIVGESWEDVAARLHAWLEAPSERAQDDSAVLVFAGQGAQWVGMGRALLGCAPAFRAAFEQCGKALRRFVEWDVIEVIESNDERLYLEQADVLQPLIFAIQVGYAALWRAWGVQVAAVVGHSLGEVAAAYVAGALRLEDACKVICGRSALMARMVGQGGMALVGLSREELEAELAPYSGKLSVAVCNSPNSTAVSGSLDALESLLATLAAREVFCRPIKINVAAHSPQMDGLCDELFAMLEDVRPVPNTLPFYSTVDAAQRDGATLDAAYWVRNLRQPVQFDATIQQLVREGHRLFIEVSPHPILVTAIEACAQAVAQSVLVLPSSRREREALTCYESLAALYESGSTLAWSHIIPPAPPVDVPTYAWQRERLWFPDEAPEQAHEAIPLGASRLLGREQLLPAPRSGRFWSTQLDQERFPAFADHRVEGASVLPAAAYVEMVSSAAALLHYGHLTDMSFDHMLVLDGAQKVQLICTTSANGPSTFEVFGHPRDAQTDWQRLAHGVMGGAPIVGPERVALEEVRLTCPHTASVETLYADFHGHGLEYGPMFQPIAELWVGDERALARLKLPDSAPREREQASAILIDGCFQVLGATRVSDAQDGGPFLPVSIAQMQVGPLPLDAASLWAYACLRPAESDEQTLAGDIVVLDDDGAVLVRFVGFTARQVARAAGQDALASWLYQVTWEASDAPAPTQEGPASWLIIGRSATLCAALRAALVQARQRVDVLALVSEGVRDSDVLVAALDALPSSRTGVIFLAAPAVPAATVDHWESEIGLLLAQALARRDLPVQLWLVTCAAQAVQEQDRVAGWMQAGLWGLGRVVGYEHPGLGCRMIDLSDAPEQDELAALVTELLGQSPETQLALRGRARYVARLAHADVTPHERPLVPATGRWFRLTSEMVGVLSELRLYEIAQRMPGPDEVVIEVEAAGLNFRDVLLALDDYPGDTSGPFHVGSECAGRIVAIGSQVRGFALGDAVVAIAIDSFSSHVIVRAELVVPKPAHLSFAEAAALPIALTTAWYSLFELARLQPGERVLIHSASGGVGIAAVRLAQWVGAEVLATAGSAEKRAYLQTLGVTMIMDSRSLAFADEVQAYTGGRGVDVVLNTLTGEAIAANMAALASYGRFVEIGKRDIYDNAPLHLRPFLKCLSYFAVDLGGMAAERPAMLGRLMREAITPIADGTIQLPPPHAFELDRAPEVFRDMAMARHIGKLVFTLEGRSAYQVIALPSQVQIRGDVTYLISGGLGGLGLTFADWLVAQGARHLALIGRRAPNAAQQAHLDELSACGVVAQAIAADVGRADDVARVLAEIEHSLPPLGGVIHAAGVLDDGIVLEQTAARLRAVSAPKADGAWHLHRLTAGCALDFFVLFSSVAGVLGSPGQSCYAAANTMLDALAARRRAEGLPGLAIAWGPWAEVGLVAERVAQQQRQDVGGIRVIRPAFGVQLFERMLSRTSGQIAALSFLPQVWQQQHPQIMQWPFLERIAVAGAASAQSDQWHVRLAQVPAIERRALLETTLRDLIADILRQPADVINPHTPFSALGFDSLMALELRNRLVFLCGIQLSATMIWNHPDIAALAVYLAERLGVELDAEASDSSAPPDANVVFSADEQAELIDLFSLLVDDDDQVTS